MAPEAARIGRSRIFSSSNPLYAVTGLLVGILVGLTGVGGGSLMTPLLVLLFRFHPATAVGTDLLCASLTKTVGSAVHHKQRMIEWRIVASLALGSVPAAVVSLLALSHLGPMSLKAASVISLFLAAALLLTAVSVFFRPMILDWADRRLSASSERNPRIRTIVLGMALGVMVSLTSVGAGALGTTALLILYPRLPTARIVATDIAHAVPLTLIAGFGHWLMGSVDLGLMVALLTGSVPGVVIGSLMSARSSDRVLRPVLAVTVLAVSLRMFAA